VPQILAVLIEDPKQRIVTDSVEFLTPGTVFIWKKAFCPTYGDIAARSSFLLSPWPLSLSHCCTWRLSCLSGLSTTYFRSQKKGTSYSALTWARSCISLFCVCCCWPWWLPMAPWRCALIPSRAS